VVLRPGAHLEAAAIVRHLRAQLAHYKCPRQVTFVDALPRTASGKVLKATLKRSGSTR
jgi:acyl-coenzyme A synthetase/AMP-(fatty) acid ligase